MDVTPNLDIPAWWRNKRVLITGHTGFKGSWLTLWLAHWGAAVTGYSLDSGDPAGLFTLCSLGDRVSSFFGDIRDVDRLARAFGETQPEIVIHMAAQPLVRQGYRNPAATFDVNVMGTVHVMERVRQTSSVRVLLNVTTDKIYENREWVWGYRESDELGASDPYAASKVCSEFVTRSYRDSFFNRTDAGRTAVATARAGNVIGGGDWSAERLVPDCLRAFVSGTPVIVRRPESVRPWQHVLEPLGGYLRLCRYLFESGTEFPAPAAWNFGPAAADSVAAGELAARLCARWGEGARILHEQKTDDLHESRQLRLDCSLAQERLGWRPRWDLDTALDKIVQWLRAYRRGDVRDCSLRQVEEYASEGVW